MMPRGLLMIRRVHAFSVARDLHLAGWGQATATTWEPADVGTGGGTCNRVTFVDGLAQSNINLVETQQINPLATAPKPQIGAVLDSTTSGPMSPAEQGNVANGTVTYSNWFAPLLGLHYAQAMQFASVAGGAYYNPGLFAVELGILTSPFGESNALFVPTIRLPVRVGLIRSKP